MIVNHIAQWNRSVEDVPVWRQVFDFLSTLSPYEEEGEREIQGRYVYARILKYPTIARGPDAILESHQDYIDVQMPLQHSEGIEWHPKESLRLLTPYDHKLDRALYRHPATAPLRVNLVPGLFAIFFPEDAHMPALETGDPSGEVRKVVVKVQTRLVRPS